MLLCDAVTGYVRVLDMKKTCLAGLERREAMLLGLVDRQVEIKQEILGEMRLEVAAARARVLAAQEEGMYNLYS